MGVAQLRADERPPRLLWLFLGRKVTARYDFGVRTIGRLQDRSIWKLDLHLMTRPWASTLMTVSPPLFPVASFLYCCCNRRMVWMAAFFVAAGTVGSPSWPAASRYS